MVTPDLLPILSNIMCSDNMQEADALLDLHEEVGKCNYSQCIIDILVDMPM